MKRLLVRRKLESFYFRFDRFKNKPKDYFTLMTRLSAKYKFNWKLDRFERNTWLELSSVC